MRTRQHQLSGERRSAPTEWWICITRARSCVSIAKRDRDGQPDPATLLIRLLYACHMHRVKRVGVDDLLLGGGVEAEDGEGVGVAVAAGKVDAGNVDAGLAEQGAERPMVPGTSALRGTSRMPAGRNSRRKPAKLTMRGSPSASRVRDLPARRPSASRPRGDPPPPGRQGSSVATCIPKARAHAATRGS